MYFSAATIPGTVDEPNEDWVAASPTAVVVLDGVTVFKEVDTGCRHGTPWYVNQLGTRLLAAASLEEVSLQSALESAIGAVAELHADTCNLDQIGAPSAAVGVLRIGKYLIDYLVLADVAVLFDSTDGLKVVTDQRVTGTLKDLAPQGDINAEVMKRRQRYRNREGGYWVAAADPSAAKHAKIGHIPLAGFRCAAMMSDGVTRLVTPFAQTDWHGILAVALKSGPTAVLEHVRKVEAADARGKRWPRSKASDDATIALIGT